MRNNCPHCGSDNIYNHDKGWNYIIRLLLIQSRMVCHECKSTWRRNSPNQFAKLKIRKKTRVIVGAEYFITPWKEAKNHNTQEEITDLMSRWQIKGKVHICFDFEKVEKLDLNDRSRLVKFSRKLKSISGNLIINNPTQHIYNELISLNLGFLVAGNQKIKNE